MEPTDFHSVLQKAMYCALFQDLSLDNHKNQWLPKEN